MNIAMHYGAWREIARSRIRVQYMYRFAVILHFLLAAVTIYLLTVVWRSAYGDSTEVDGIPLKLMLVYLTIGNLQSKFLRPEIGYDIVDRIRQGQIGFDISRPVSYPSQLVATEAGLMLGMAPMLILVLPVAGFLGELAPPASWEAGIGYAASFLIAWLIAVELSMIIGLVAFWTLEMTGFMMVYNLVGSFATGALVPLWFMPDLLRQFVQLLPFQSIVYIPVSIYIGIPATGHIATALLLQCFWAVVLVGVIAIVWKRAMIRTVIQGG
ncbi:MAG: ABC-2 family transporter protein [Thermomicrobiales bacterium]|nr:ABC-2 family transporter protein [Thermomicrobiales bacterium]